MAVKFDHSLVPASPDLSLERSLFNSGVAYLAGLDEAGRGAWAGPVTAAAVVRDLELRVDPLLGKVRDSKQLNPEQRWHLEPVIKNNTCAWGIGFASNEEIDLIGILPATRLAMTRALESLDPTPLHLLIDALFLPEIAIPQTALIKGDQRSLSIAAASILAKTARDRFMQELATRENRYRFERNKGYGTRTHQAALQTYGPCPLHRFSYSPVKSSIK
jgi:ribonuclease HII